MQTGDFRRSIGPTAFVPLDVEIGSIVMWSGLIANIPTGYHLCDGSAGTPDLRDRFIRHAQTQDEIGNTGGEIEHSHTFQGDGHTHNIIGGTALAAGADKADTTDSTQVAGTTNVSPNMPHWYALAFIMRIS